MRISDWSSDVCSSDLSGTDIAVLWGMLWHIFENGWEDKEFIAQRVYAMDDVREEVKKYPPDEVERISGVSGDQLKHVAEMFATDRTSGVWGKSVSVRVDLGGRRMIKKKKPRNI